MGKLLRSTVILASLSTICSAQTITETFGTGANAFTMDFVQIGNPGNVADTTGIPNPAGSVSYIYNIGKYEISRDMVSKANSAGSLGITMSDMTLGGGNWPNKPATGISWIEAAKFVNYLNVSSGNAMAYKFNAGGTFQLWSSTDAGYNPTNAYRNSLAKYFLPSTDEWYKAAFGSPTGIWSDYSNGLNTPPEMTTGGSTGAVYGANMSGPADIAYAGGMSAWGTVGQGGNVWEVLESASDHTNNSPNERREYRGGSWANINPEVYLSSSATADGDIMIAYETDGFRVASVPEPSSLSLLALGGVLVALGRRKR